MREISKKMCIRDRAGEQRLQRVEHHPFGSDGINRVIEPHKQPLQIIIAALLDFARFDVDLSLIHI